MRIHGASVRPSNLVRPKMELTARDPAFGLWSTYRDPSVVERMAAEGFDWIGVDGQHGHAEPSDYGDLVEAVHLYGVPTAIRVASHEAGVLGRSVDTGTNMVIVPTVETAEQAQRILEICRFAPRGKRSFGPTRTIPRYSSETPGTPGSDPLVALMIETAVGLAHLDEILSVGPDAIFVGPYDLSLSCGWTLEELTLGARQDVLQDIAQRTLAAGVVPGIYAGEITLSQQMAEIGYRFMPVSTDAALIAAGARQLRP